MNTLKHIFPHAGVRGWIAVAFLLFTEGLLLYYTLIAEGTGL